MQNATIRSPDTLRSQRVPPGQKLTEKFPVLHHGSVPPVGVSAWNFQIEGLIKQPRTLSFQEFSLLPRVRVFSDLHCVTGWSRLNNTWEGVSSQTIKDIVDILPEARYVMVHGAGGFTTNLPIDEFFAEDVLFAFTHDDKPITAEHGAPVRLVVPRLYLWKSAKWANGVEFMAQDKPGFWESFGYHMHGDPWTEERYGGR